MAVSLRTWLEKVRARRRAARKAPLRRWRPLVEALEDRTVPSINLPTPGTPGPVTVTGTAGPDQFVIRLQPGNPTNVQFSDNGGASFQTAALSDVTSVTVNGLAGNDRLVIDNGNGLVGNALSGGLPITFNGGPGIDILFLRGGTVDSETLTEGATPSSGTLTSTSGSTSETITFNRVESLLETTAATNLTVNLTGGNDRVVLANGPTIDGVRTTVLRTANAAQLNEINPEDVNASDANDRNANSSEGNHGDSGQSDDGDSGETGDDNSGDANSSAAGATEVTGFAFANKANVTINALGGDDLIGVNLTRPGAGLTALTIDGGPGNDTVIARKLPAGVTTSFPNVERVITDLDDAFVRELYQLRLGRFAGDDEVRGWEQVLRSSGRDAVVRGIELSPEAREDLVRGWYQQFLHRTPQGGEERGWVNALLRGEAEEQVLANILGSPEFYNLSQTLISSGTPDERFVQALYLVVLNRDATPAELSGWLRALPNVGRQGLALAFLESQEFRTEEVEGFYQDLLQRTHDDEGMHSWVASGLSLRDVRLGFEDSDEFFGNG